MQSRECVKTTSDREIVYKYTACACVFDPHKGSEKRVEVMSKI